MAIRKRNNSVPTIEYVKCIAGLPIAVYLGYSIAQHWNQREMTKDYFELEATLVNIQEDCYMEGNPLEYFACPAPAPAPPPAAKGGKPPPTPPAQNTKIRKHAVLWYAYRHPQESGDRQAPKEYWSGKPAQIVRGHKTAIHVKKDDPSLIRWMNSTTGV